MRRAKVIAVGTALVAAVIALALLALALVLPGASREASATDWCSGGVCQEWAARYDGPASLNDEAAALAVDGSGNVYVTGASPGSGTSYDYATLKYDAGGVEQWAARYDGPASSDDWAEALAVDGSGNVYVTGWSPGSGTGDDYATVKYDAGGVQQWAARYDGPPGLADQGTALAVDGAGNVYVTGYSTDSDLLADYATVKYDAGGVQQWVARYNSPAGGGAARALAVDGSGNVYVTGWSPGSGTGEDYATVKYNAGGVEQWAARYDGPASGDDLVKALAVDGSGNVYVTGYSPGSGTGQDYATVKYDAGGAEQWVARYDGPAGGGDYAYALALDGSGNVYVTGYSYDPVTASDYATVKYNAGGAEQWVARYDGPTSDYDGAYALALDGAGSIYVTGGSPGSGTGWDYATVKYDADGVEQWVARYDGPASSDDEAYALAVDGSGNVYVTGISPGSGTGWDYATAKYSEEGTPTPTPTNTPTPTPALTLGALLPFQGSLAEYGPVLLNGAQLAADDINDAGGVLGGEVQIVQGDTETDPAIGVSEALRLINTEGASVIVGAVASGVSLPVAEQATVPNGILQISPASTSPYISTLADDDLLFRTALSDAVQGAVLAELAWELGYRTASTLYVNNGYGYGQGLSDAFAEEFQRRGGQVPATVPHAEGQSSYLAELEAATAGNPDVLVAISFSDDATVYLTEAIQNALIDQFLFVEGTKSQTMIDDVCAVAGAGCLDGTYGTAPAKVDSPAGTAFDTAYELEYGEPPPLMFAREAYDGVLLAALAAEAAGSSDPSLIRDELRDISRPGGEAVGLADGGIAYALGQVGLGQEVDYEGAAGCVDLDAYGDVACGAIEIWRIESDDIETVRTDPYEPTPGIYVVDSTGDGGDSSAGDLFCDDGSGKCTLRAAIEEANADGVSSAIHFSIGGGGVQTITPGSYLPGITQPVVIDGTSQPGYAGNPIIELNGSMWAGDGLVIAGGNSTVQGLVINRFGGVGVRLTSAGNVIKGNYIGTNVGGTVALGNADAVVIENVANNTIGGTASEARNVISGNNNGIRITGAGAAGNTVQGNFIGTDVSGAVALGNSGIGVWINAAPGNTIGGTTAGARNVISGNSGPGVDIREGATGNQVQGNYIGTDVTGTANLGNSHGVYISGASGNTIGGTTAGARNVISGNDSRGVFIIGGGATGNVVQGNFIGTDATGSADLGNGDNGVKITEDASNNIVGGTTGTTPGGPCTGACNVISGNDGGGVGIGIASSGTGNQVQGNYIGTDLSGTLALGNGSYGVGLGGSNNTVGGSAAGAWNIIAYNGVSGGVIVGSGTGNAIRGNSIFSNTGLGIDLAPSGVVGVTPNDAGDGDTGANNLQNFPVLASASSGSTTIEGTLNSTPSTQLVLQFYFNTSCDSSGYGEGESYLGSTTLTTNGSGDASFSLTFPQTVPPGRFITATATDPGGNTSEFSECILVTGAPIPTPTPTPTPVINRLAGTPGTFDFGGDGGPAQNALLNDPHGSFEVTNSNAFYFADTGNNRVRRIYPNQPTGIITTVAGGGTPTPGFCGDGGPATSACLDHPYDVFVDGPGNLYIADTGNNRVRKVSTGGIITTVAGGGPGCAEPCPATQQALNGPRGVAVDASGNILIADTENHRIRRVDAASGIITTVAGDGVAGFSGDGVPATATHLNRPHDVYLYGTSGDFLIADTVNNRIRRVDGFTGVILTFAGSGLAGYGGDGGPATLAHLNGPEAVAVDASHLRLPNVLIADTQNHRIRRVNGHTSVISTVAGNGTPGSGGDGGDPTSAQLYLPAGIAVGSLTGSDTGNSTLRTIDPTTGEPGGRFSGFSCTVGSVSTADWVVLGLVLGLVLARRRVRGLILWIRATGKLAVRRGLSARAGGSQ